MDETDLAALLRRCLAGGENADWDRFIRLSQPTVAAGVLRSISSSARVDRELADDLIQDTFLKLCADDFRVLRRFRGDDAVSLRVYLKTIAGTIATDHFRSQAALKKGSGKAPVSLDDLVRQPGADDARFAELEREILLERVERCLDSQQSRDRRVFWLYHRQGMTPKTISALPGVGLASDGVETLVYRLTKNVRECLQRAGLLQSAAVREGGRA